MKRILIPVLLLSVSISIAAQNNNVNSLIKMSFGFVDAATGKAVLPKQVSIKDKNNVAYPAPLKKMRLGSTLSMKLHADSYFIYIEADGYKTMNAKVNIGLGLPVLQIFNLEAVHPDKRLEIPYIQSKHKSGYTFINGFVIDENGLPVSGANLSCQTIRVRSDTDGYFEIYAIAKGTENEETVMSVTHKNFTFYQQTGIAVWPEGDWQTIVKLKKKKSKTKKRKK